MSTGVPQEDTGISSPVVPETSPRMLQSTRLSPLSSLVPPFNSSYEAIPQGDCKIELLATEVRYLPA